MRNAQSRGSPLPVYDLRPGESLSVQVLSRGRRLPRRSPPPAFTRRLNVTPILVQASLGEDDCALCLDKLLSEREKKQLCVLQCGHVFHHQCAESVLSSKCPLCRRES